jgi:hypothetical protein
MEVPGTPARLPKKELITPEKELIVEKGNLWPLEIFVSGIFFRELP